MKELLIKLLLFCVIHNAIGHSQSSILAFDKDFTLSNLYKNKLILLQVGAFDAHQGRQQDIGINSLIGDHYSLSKSNATNMTVGLGYYLKERPFHSINLMYGLNLLYFGSTQVKGLIYQEHLYSNLAYNYNIINLPIYLSAKAVINNAKSEKYNFTVDLGLGPNFIQSKNFKNYSIDGGITLPDYVFANHTSVSGSLMGGIGVRFNQLIKAFDLECGYRFFYFGQGSFKNINSQISNRLKTGHSYANALFLVLYYS